MRERYSRPLGSQPTVLRSAGQGFGESDLHIVCLHAPVIPINQLAQPRRGDFVNPCLLGSQTETTAKRSELGLSRLLDIWSSLSTREDKPQSGDKRLPAEDWAAEGGFGVANRRKTDALGWRRLSKWVVFGA